MLQFFKWLLILIFLHCLNDINSTPLAAKVEFLGSTQSNCSHFSIGELVKNSPIILKTLAVRRHANVVQQTTMGLEKNKSLRKNSYSTTPSMDIESARLTLVPETIYRGASLLNFITIRDLNGISDAFENNGDKVDENSLNQQYRNLNASLQPLACFNTSLLHNLPMEIIAFGKLDTLPIGKYQQVVDGYISMPFFRFNNYGFQRWTQELENEVWKLLGWDEWSEFTTCSKTCGGGRQQRFRRCLLDNPTIKLYQNSIERNRLYIKEDEKMYQSDQNYQNKENSKKGLFGNLLKKTFKHQIETVSKSQYPIATTVSIVNRENVSFQTQTKSKITTGYSTMFCEGFKVEQRGCNAFECDDMLDVLQTIKSYLEARSHKKSNKFKTNNRASKLQMKHAKKSVSFPTENNHIQMSSNWSLGINWQNALSFTILITFRVKNVINESRTIYSISNDTHNFVLKSMEYGVLFNVEANGKSVNLPLEFNLGDNHWHQLAISVRNGDFVSVHVDCSWTKSFVTSRHLVSLPLNAHIEIGLNLKADLLQLVVLPESNGHNQCSKKRISINEVNRYIIGFEMD